ncbi:helix-turn-helix domain containing protein [Taylorella equigenitalis]|uniref:helix-turn-helix domain-containing protein n=1 Tax=Taylorella equigenitalis TaxID=29575 RepID=UPI00237D2760|nr:helix-turn-helix domain-containing protein [Taylorella equigenitalis]WDU48704.1 helix-turn-helix domain containing protein [Taylorella equigenitalis]WDU51180.1 helix-turn-helix domain containing protein [Taylorella equigenitalis]
MNFKLGTDFEAKIARLKNELNVKTDKEVAEFFNLSPNSFSDRRIRNSFPDRKLKEIVMGNPKWKHIDLEWVLTGMTATEYEVNETIPMDIHIFEEKANIAFSRLSELSSEQQKSIFYLIDSMYFQKKKIDFYKDK